jgi:hypothetical protein
MLVSFATWSLQGSVWFNANNVLPQDIEIPSGSHKPPGSDDADSHRGNESYAAAGLESDSPIHREKILAS